jgi:hypothetical protein
VTEPPEVNSAEWWAEHGVADEVRAARPYVRWTTDDVEPVREAYAGLTPGQQTTLLRWAAESDGLIIYRHSFEPPRDFLGRVYPEIRPDQPVVTETIWHYHGPPSDEPPSHPSTGTPLPAQHVHTREEMQEHIARSRDPDDHRGRNTRKVHPHRRLAKYLFPPAARGKVAMAHSHKQEFANRVLYRRSEKRRVPGGWEWTMEPTPPEEQERLKLEFAAWLKDHLRRFHAGEARSLATGPDVDARVRKRSFARAHLHEVPTIVTGQQLAKRIDVNPLVRKRGGFDEADCVFFGIEGCIKADAILTALLKAGEPPAVFSVPSVSLWEATYPAKRYEFSESGAEVIGDVEPGDELGAFASRYLVDKLVCIVPDADAHTKDEVMAQALLCRSTLRRLGAHAEIVLPPDDRLADGIKGVDDYLGVGGGTLDGLVWYHKEAPDEDKLEAWIRRQPREARWRTDGMRRAVRTLQALALHAGENGDYTASVRVLARAIGRRQRPVDPRPHTALEEIDGRDPIDIRDPVDGRDADAARKWFERGINDLLEIRAISSSKPLGVRRERWIRTKAGLHKQSGLHWAEEGVVVTIHEELRAPAKRRSIRSLRTRKTSH